MLIKKILLFYWLFINRYFNFIFNTKNYVIRYIIFLFWKKKCNFLKFNQGKMFSRPSGGRGDLLGPDDPRYRQFEICKCAYSFNCPSTGLNFVSFSSIFFFFYKACFCLGILDRMGSNVLMSKWYRHPAYTDNLLRDPTARFQMDFSLNEIISLITSVSSRIEH